MFALVSTNTNTKHRNTNEKVEKYKQGAEKNKAEAWYVQLSWPRAAAFLAPPSPQSETAREKANIKHLTVQLKSENDIQNASTKKYIVICVA